MISFWPIGCLEICCLVFTFVDFLDCLLLIYNFIPLWSRKDSWYDYSLLKFANMCCGSYQIIYPGECSMCTWQENVFYAVGWNVLCPFVLKFGPILTFSCWWSIWIGLYIADTRFWNCLLLLHCVQFLYSALLVFAEYILLLWYVGCIYIYNY